MGKNDRLKAVVDPRRGRALAPRAGGVKKHKKKEAKKTAEDGDAEKGVVSKRKRTFYAVRVGKTPGVYTDVAEFERQIKGYSGAESRKFYKRRLAEEYVRNEARARRKAPNTLASIPEDQDQSRRAFVRFDTSSLPRGFSLGTVRLGGKSVLVDASKPLFSITAPRTAADVPSFPQHAALDISTAPEASSKSRTGGGAAQAPEPPETDGAAAHDTDGEVAVDDDEAQQKRARTNGANADRGAPGADEAEGTGGAPPTPPQASAGALDDDFIAFASSSDDDSAEAGEGSAEEGGLPPDLPEPVKSAGKRVWHDDELPWHDANVRIAAQSVRLHNEIVELTSLLRPSEEEDSQRLAAKALLDGVVKGIFPTAEVEIFGSFATSLHLPTSDVDCVMICDAVHPSGVPQALTAIGRALQREDWATDLEVITRAKVPIVKLVVMPYGLKFDISIGQGNGIDAAHYIRDALRAWPPLRPIVTVLKLFLLQRNMNEVYSGGLGSFALILSVIAFLQLHPSRTSRSGKPQPLDCNLGVLLIDYFRFYGRQLAFHDVGVSCNDGGHCYRKAAARFDHPRDKRDRGDRYSIMDPLNRTNDVARGCFNSTAVRYAFDHAYHMLMLQPSDLRLLSQREERALRGKPLLGSILRLNDVLAIRPPPERLHRASAGGGRPGSGRSSGSSGGGGGRFAGDPGNRNSAQPRGMQRENSNRSGGSSRSHSRRGHREFQDKPVHGKRKR